MTGNILVFTLHKSASMFLHQQCQWLCRLAHLPYHSPNVRESQLDARRLLTDKTIWQERHGCFAPIRFYVDVPDIANDQVILHLRDPRDVLVSMFYSYCFIHNGEVAGNTSYRKEVAARGIDAFVLDKISEKSRDYTGDYGTGGHVEDLIGNLPARYQQYLTHLVGQPNVTLLKYEDMVTDYQSWLTRFIQPFPIADKDKVIQELVANKSVFFPARNQDEMTHVRHVTPGDYLNKLLPETIAILNDKLSGILIPLGYAPDPEKPATP